MRSRALLVAVVVFVLTLVAPATALAQRTIGLSSGSFSFDVGPGSSATGTVDVMNDGDETLTVLAYAADQKVDDKGGITYQVPGRDQSLGVTGPASWITLEMPTDAKAVGNVPSLQLEPGERVPVSFQIAVPSNVPSGDHNLIVFFEMQGKTAEGNASSAVAGRLGARVRLRVSGNVVRKLSVRPFAVPSFVIGRKIGYDFMVRNAGNVDERVTAAVTLLDRSENTVGSSSAIDAKTVFAQSNLAAKGTLLAVKPLIGPQTLLLTLTPTAPDGAADGASSAIEESRTVWVVPLWLVSVFGVLFAALLVGIAISIFRRLRPAPRPHPSVDEETDVEAA